MLCVYIYRNFLTNEQFQTVTKRDHNFAGYMDIDGIINPTSLWTTVEDIPEGNINIWNKLYVYIQIYMNHAWLLLQTVKSGECVYITNICIYICIYSIYLWNH